MIKYLGIINFQRAIVIKRAISGNLEQGRTGPANIRTMFEAPLCLFPHVGAAKIFTNCSFMHEVKRKSTNSSVYKETGNPPGPLFSIFDSLARFLCSQYLNTNVTYISQIIRGLYVLRPASWALFLRRPSPQIFFSLCV